ncbi:MAG: serine--tRNA ligase [Phycisphaerales bacterium]|nr:serine--tRNA ligase [Phycisphaerales bacterium]
MIDLKALRANPDLFKNGARLKGMDIDIDRLLLLDEQRRELMSRQEVARSQQKRLGKEVGPQLGKLKGQLKSAPDDQRPDLEAQVQLLEAKPAALKQEIHDLDEQLKSLEPEWRHLWLCVPQPPDEDVPVGASADQNVELRTWNPSWFDPAKTFEKNKGFQPKSHIELVKSLGLADFERGVKIAGSRSYVLTGDGMRLHQAILQLALQYITEEHGFQPVSVPVIVREQSMEGTAFFPHGKDQAYLVDEQHRGGTHDLWLTGTGEVSLMSLHSDEILNVDQLPLKYATCSTCFRREAGAAGKDTAGLYRIHQFDKVEQVVICRADEEESRAWHKTMLGIVESLLQQLELPYRLLQCCTGDLGPKNADMIDIECWMPSRGDEDADGMPKGHWGETHSASRLYDYQCRRLNIRYNDADQRAICHSLNNTVVASPRILIPILELYQNQDGSVTVPEVLRPLMRGKEVIR